MRHLITWLFGVLCVMNAAHAAVQGEAGWYGSLNGGVLFPSTQSVGGVNLSGAFSPQLTDRVGYRNGWTFGAAAGYATSDGWRAEVEIASHLAKVSSAFGDPRLNIAVLCFVADPNCGALGATGGRTSATSFMINGLRDIPIGDSWAAHVGLGVGFAALLHTDIGQARASSFGSPILNGLHTVFAYQAIAGVSRAIGPRLWLDADYRYFATARATFDQTRNSQPSARFVGHGVTAGVRLQF